jgi:tyrosinase
MTHRKRLTIRLATSVAVLTAAALLLTACPPNGNGNGNGPTGPTGPIGPTGPTGPTGPGPAVHVRAEIDTLAPAQIDAYRAGVALMQSRANTDPTSWIYQANIHGVPGAGSNCPANQDPIQEAWDTCQHGSFFFLAWHRMYLYYFERILRSAVQEAAGDPGLDFALPYWDYDGGAAQLPVPFRSPADASNSLFTSARRAPCNNVVPGQSCISGAQGSAVQALATVPVCNCPSGQASCDGCIAGLFSDETFHGQFTPAAVHFLGQFGELESQPHNIVHVLVGGNTGWMVDPDCAARDAIFWLHHANIDRLWQVWLNQNAGRVNPIGSNAWTTQTFTFFDENGQKVTHTGCDVLNMATQLDYEYDGVPVQNVVLCAAGPGPATPTPAPPSGAAPEMTAMAATADTGFTLGAETTTVTVPMSPAALATAGTGKKARLVVEGLEILGKGGVYEVYFNLPAGEAPASSSPHFVGHVALFGHVGHGHDGPSINRSFDVSDELAALSGDVDLTFVPTTGVEAGASLLKFKRASLVQR